MSKAKNTTVPDDRGMYKVWCDPCDESGTFPTLAEAVLARRLHLCDGEVPSYSWPGWELGLGDD